MLANCQRIALSIILLTFSVKTVLAAELPALTGEQIAAKQDATNQNFGSETMQARMVLVSADNQSTSRELIFKTLEGSSGDKSLVKFLAPADIMGTGLLSYQNKSRSDDQWLFLPALKKTKRIAGTSKGGSFVGSDFSYEDLVPFDINKYDYTFLREEILNGKSCYVNEAHPKDSQSTYSKTVSWIDSKSFQTLKADFYDKKGRHAKTALFLDIRTLNGRFYRPFKIIMNDLRKGSHTELTFTSIHIGDGLKSDEFTERALMR